MTSKLIYVKEPKILGIENCRKVIVPSTMRSTYWKYFGFPATVTGEIITRKKIICIICQSAISYNRNTTNLKTHLMSKHFEKVNQEFSGDMKRDKISKDLIQEVQAKVKVVKGVTEVATKSDGPIFIKQEIFDKDVLEMFGQDEIIHSVEVENINGEEEDSAQMEYEESEAMFEIVDEISDHSELISTHAILDDCRLKSRILGMLVNDLTPACLLATPHFKQFCKSLNSNFPDDMLTKTSIDSMISSAHQDMVSTLLNPLEEYSQQFPYSLSFDEWDHVGEDSYVTMSFWYLVKENNTTRLKDVVFFSSKICDTDEIIKALRQLNLNNCRAAVLNCRTSYMTSFMEEAGIRVLPCFVKDIETGVKAVFDIPKVKQLFDLISDYFEESPWSNDETDLIHHSWLSKFKYLERFLLRNNSSPEELNNAQILVDCLSPLKEILYILFDEQNLQMSLVLPFVDRLIIEHYIPCDDDDSLVCQIKDILRDNLIYEAENKQFMKIASFLDPRLHHILDQEDVEKIENDLRLKVNNAHQPLKKEDTGEGRKSGLRGFFKTLHKSSMTSDPFNTELNAYRNINLALDDNALTWWSNHMEMFPNLGNMADVYNCVPLCAQTHFKRPLDEQEKFLDKRFMLVGKINEVLTLNLNKYNE